MNILNLEHINKIYGDKVIFDDISLGIENTDKIGVVGINGTGKTTLLKMIAGLTESDSGEVITKNSLHISYLEQHPAFPKGITVLEAVLSGRTEEEYQARKILNVLDLRNADEAADHLSGGEKKRLALARTLLAPSQLLILDEPTNHLDNEMVTWLENFLIDYKGAMIMVTHDRYFLDRVTNKILEISHGKTYLYETNYSGFLDLKAQREEMEIASQRKRNSLLRMEIEWAKRGARARSTKQKARLMRLEDLKNARGPVTDQKIEVDSVDRRMGKKTILLHHISKSFADRIIIHDFDYIILKNSRLGIIGPNGSGKSTLLKIIMGEVLPDSGSVEIGDTVKIGYFSQEIPDMDSTRKVIDYIKDVAEYIPTKDGLISASKLLEQFLFDSALQYSQIGRLSGGEKKRLYLLKVLAAAPNVLLLDEITNDLDIPTLTILEDYLETFAGIVVAVSHDRYFLDNFADRILAFEEGGFLRQYEGDYTDYQRARGTMKAGSLEGRSEGKPEGKKEEKKEDKKEETAEADSSKKAKKSWKGDGPAKLKFTFKEQREFDTIDEEIEKLESALKKIDEDMKKNASNSGKLNDLLKEQTALEEKLEEKMQRWEYLNELAEKIEAQKQT